MEHLIKITIESIPMASVLNSYEPNDLLYRDICSSDQPTRDDQKVVKLVSAVRNGLERKKADQTDPDPKVTEMRKSQMSSIVVDVACQTELSFLSFMEDFKDVKDRLEAEFENSELPWRLYVTNDNEAEVHERLKNIRLERVKRAVCLIECMEGELKWSGTGFYYGKGWIMTAAHNLRDPSKDNETSHSCLSGGKFRVLFDIGGKRRYEFADGRRMAFFHHLQPLGKSADLKNKDIGMVRLGRQWEWGREEHDYSQWEKDENKKLEEMESHFPPLVQTDAPHAKAGDNAYAVYYVGGKKKVVKVTITGISEGKGEIPMLHLEKQPGVLPAGSSGCPVLIEKYGKYHLLGLHFAGSDDESYGKALALQWKHGIEDFLEEGVSIIAAEEGYMAKSSLLAGEHGKLFEKEVNVSESDLKSRAKKAKLSIYSPNGKVFDYYTGSS